MKDEMTIQLEQMVTRYQQLTNPEENLDQLYIQQLLNNLVSDEDHNHLLKHLDPSQAIQEDTMRMIEHKLTQMDFDVEEVKQTQPRFFEMLMLCYQVNLTKLQQQLGDDAVIQFADECLKESVV